MIFLINESKELESKLSKTIGPSLSDLKKRRIIYKNVNVFPFWNTVTVRYAAIYNTCTSNFGG